MDGYEQEEGTVGADLLCNIQLQDGTSSIANSYI